MLIGQHVGPFLIEKELGSGAMGTVYKAKYDKDGKTVPVALKVVALGLLGNEGAMARFDREANILKQLRHPNIVRLFATGKYRKTPFIAMEFVDGESMDRILGRRSRFGWEEVIGYGKHLCLALQHAHEKGIIHRDLKPSNLMVARDGTLKLTDFGIAKDTDVTALTAMNSTIGTAAYMSPEQCKGERNLTNKSDLYSLGVVFYELVAGRKPFITDQTVDMFLKHVGETPPRPTRFVPDLPVWFDNLIMFLLEKDKDKRPIDAATVGQMLADIEAKVQNQQSAGAEVANARRMDRRAEDAKPLDDTDREAARTLRAGTKGSKPKKKKKGRPWYQREWVKAVPLVLFVGLLAAGGYWFFKPKSPEQLFAEIESATGPKKRELAEKYLDRYGSEAGEVTDKVRGSLREIRGKDLEVILDKRFRNRDKKLSIKGAQEGEDEKVYGLTWSALESEEKGDIARAGQLWQKVKEAGATVDDNYKDGWVWLADKHATAINALDKELDTLRQKVFDFQVDEKPIQYDPTDPESLATQAIRFGGTMNALASNSPRKLLPYLTDPPRARKEWATLADLTRDKQESRAWFLLASREREKVTEVKPEEALAQRKKLIEAQLAVVQAAWADTTASKADQRDCRSRVQDLIDLYMDDPDVKKGIDEAKAFRGRMN